MPRTADAFFRLQAAHEVLADADRKAEYDRMRDLGAFSGGGGFGGFGGGAQSRFEGAREVNRDLDDYADSDGSDGAGRRNIEAGRAKLMELQYEQFRKEMASRLEEKNRKIQTMEDENARLRDGGGSDAEVPGMKCMALT